MTSGGSTLTETIREYATSASSCRASRRRKNACSFGHHQPSVELQHGGVAAHELGQPTLVSGVVEQLEVGDLPADGELADGIHADPVRLARAVRRAHRAPAGTRLVSSASAK